MTPDFSVVHVWDAEYPWDVRVEKISRALTDAGIAVDILARNRKGQPSSETLAEGTVRRMRPLPLLSPGPLDAASQFPAFFNPRWYTHMRRVARAHQRPVLLVRDLPLAPTAVAVGRRLRIPVIFDMAEDYPAMIRDLWSSGRNGPLDGLVRNPRAVSAIERWVLERVDHTLVVVEESEQRLREQGVPAERISIVSNTPDLDAWPGRRSHGNDTSSPLKLVYLGGMQFMRGIVELLEAVRILEDRGTSVEVHLIGDGHDLPVFQDRARELGIEAQVHLHGFMPLEAALPVVAEADIGVVPHHKTEHTNTTVPNKLFDYMATELPVIVGDAAPLERIVTTHRCGAVFRSGDASSLAEAISSLGSREARVAAGQRGREAVEATYNWSREVERLLGAFDIVRSGSASP